MSNEHETDGLLDPVAQPFATFWSNYLEQANNATHDLLAGVGGIADVKNWQRDWSDAVSKSLDAYMRSPVFLQAMKQNADLMIKAKRQSDDLTTEIARNANIPTAGDISGLFERMHSVEEVILKRLGSIEERLKTIEELVGADQAVGNV